MEADKDNKKHLHLYAKMFILGSLVLLLSVHYIELYLPDWHVLQELVKEVGISLFIVGAISIVIEIGDFSEYFLTKLTDIVIRDAYIDRLHEKDKRDLIKRVEQSLYFKNRPYDENSFYNTMKSHILPMMESYYYNNYDIIVECWIIDNVIYKSVKRSLEIVNPFDENIKVKIPIASRMKKIANVDDNEHYKLKVVQINGEDKTSDVKCECKFTSLNEDGPSGYELQITCGYNLTLLSNSTANIYIETETQVPISDVTFEHTVPAPCKNYKATFLMRNEEYIVIGLGFGLRAQDTMTTVRLKSGLVITFNDWILRDDGVHFFIKKE